MATINLGAIKFNWKGAYNSGTSYAVDDVVSSGGNSYVCIQAHSNQAVGNATAYWNIMSSAGAAGAEGGTSTFTTRGDLLFRGASAPERLPKGTAGYYLKQGANDPEWSAVASDFVKISTGGSGTDVGHITLTLDKTTYAHFEIYLQMIPTTDGQYVRSRLRNASGALTGSNYMSSYVQTQGGGGSISSQHENGTDEFHLTGNGGFDDNEGHGLHIIYTPHHTSSYGQSGGTYNANLMTWQGFRIDESGNWRDIRGGGHYKAVIDDITGLDFYYSSGNIAMYNYTLYGRKR